MIRLVCCWILMSVLAACEPAPTREKVLHALVGSTLLPAQRELATESAALVKAAHTLAPEQASLARVRTQWRATLLAWERVYALRLGPAVDNSGLLRARFWPVRERSLQALLEQPKPLTADEVAELGVDLRGMYALEWLLFGEPSRTVLLARDDAGARGRALVTAFAENAHGYADDALHKLGDGATLTASLVSAQQETISKLVNQMVATVETLASGRLAPVLEMHARHNMQLGEVQGQPSGVSTALVAAQLRETERIYLGAQKDGLQALVVSVAPAIDQRVRERFAKASKLVEQLGGPLEYVVTHERAKLEDAFRALKELEMSLKVDLASALAVTLTFSAGDGD